MLKLEKNISCYELIIILTGNERQKNGKKSTYSSHITLLPHYQHFSSENKTGNKFLVF